MPLDTTIPKKPFVHYKKSGDGKIRAAYRRVRPDGTEFRVPLPPADPDGDVFVTAYRAAEQRYEGERAARATNTPPEGTVAAAVALYQQSADYRSTKSATRRLYDYHLHLFGHEFGHLSMRDIDYGWVDTHRTKWFNGGRINTWNEIRKVMGLVTEHFMNHHPRVVPQNYWKKIKRLTVAIDEAERQNRPWPREVIVAVFRAATPQFRALLTHYLFTGQRGSDVVRFGDAEVVYDPTQRVLTFTQVKGGRRMDLPAPESLHGALIGPEGQPLLLTPRGKRWNTLNAQDTLRTLLTNLGLPRYTLHGLRSTVATELALLGFGELVLKAQGGWEDSRTVRGYLRGVEQKKILAPAAKALEARFEPMMREAEVGATAARAAGLTGRAAAKAGMEGRARDRRAKKS